MVFSSLEFIFRFLPAFLVLYYLVPVRYRNVVLLLGSIIFYTLGDYKYLILLFLSVIVNYIAAKNIRQQRQAPTRKKAWLIAALMYNFGMLFFFKYINFAIENINGILTMISPDAVIASLKTGLPLGVSFYTFQAAAYIIDVYRGDVEEEPSILQLGTYLFMFPKLVSGPITPYEDIKAQLVCRRNSFLKVEEGLKVFTIGLGMKVLLANRIGILWNDIQTIGFQSISTPLAWLGAFGYSLQLYFDFQGYTLMAIGIGKMMGFELPDNFNHPYISKSVTEFWRRWHITLGKWFKNYVYIPLGGNRRGKGRLAFNLFVVWLLTGLWHGASWNYILWGLSLFFLILLEKLYLKPYLDKSKVLARLYMLLVIPLTWMLFAINNLTDAGIYFGRMFSLVPGISVNPYDIIKYLGQYKWLFLFGIFFCLPYGQKWFEKYKNSIWSTGILFLIFWYCVYQLANGINNPFLYFQF
ncbi:MBOAT family O-acyltransferase [Anaerocolumna xylanovorans]|uniref:Alginate O-acetyltransferase complex protein AlgI n=1 Tax=Anaerocolumna xylanovorans DSM 12503 TaxID=1121345 RepID=A0A1M7YFT7_9FIRM|nr:MBOAT family O-acyltransferase [Anaerocolumna xylanovorans]SHO51502.1 alginate O-acetyltransferase complex protein AlgI [Anaerocolumna xylanovorans DSM 12503]